MNRNAGLVIGITGQTGSGKTLVASLLTKYGFHIIDADVVSRKVVEKGRPALDELVNEFGAEILQVNGDLNRGKLADIAFNDPAKQQALNRITHPHIIAEVKDQIRLLKGHGAELIFIDAPTLFESGADKMCDKILAVIAPRELRCQRILNRDSITPEQAEARLDSQHDDDFYTSRSDYIIENNAEPHLLETQIIHMLSDLGYSKNLKP